MKFLSVYLKAFKQRVFVLFLEIQIKDLKTRQNIEIRFIESRG